tara:strand:- start:83 stop:1474 length:1392 start_codon:yes stop_codon:yes gene_type:complete
MKTFFTHLDEYSFGGALNPQFNYGGSSTGPGLDQYVPMVDLNAQSEKEIKKSDLDQIEKYADRLFASLDIDVEFTRHFLDRVNDQRNRKQITPAELTRLFKQSHKKYGKTIAKLGPDAQAVINDMKTDINMPFVLNVKGGELELVAKTVMRKKDFKTSNRKLSFENFRKTEDISEISKKDIGDIIKAIKLLATYYKTGKEEDAFKAIKFGWSYIQNPKVREAIVSLVKHVASKYGHTDWNGTVKYIKKKTGVDISDYKQDWTRVKGGYTFTKFIPEQYQFFPKKLHERITLPLPPLDLQAEADKIKEIIANRTEKDIQSIKDHDENSFYAIDMYCKKHGLIFHKDEMKDIVTQARPTIGYFKKHFNVDRPHEVDPSIKPMASTTNKTRSYPSGHACQSMLVGLYVASKFPLHEKGVIEAAKECGLGRVKAGFHYLADYVAGNLLAEKMFLVMNRDNYGNYIKE